jgi:multidrug efflux pump subunit AcrA (membrane-fusion protein)
MKLINAFKMRSFPMNSNNLSPSSSFFAREMTDRQKTTLRMGGLVVAIAGIAVAVGSMGAFARSTSSNQQTKLQGALPVEVLTAQQVSSALVDRQFTGTLVAARASELAFERNGKILSVIVDEGDDVEIGQTLATLDRRHLTAQQAQLDASRNEAAAILAELEAGPRKEKIAAAQADVRNLAAQLALLHADYSRHQRLRQQRVISQEEFDRTSFNVKAAQARLDASQRRLDELVAGTRVEKVAAARAKVARLDAELQDLAADIEDTRLVAPFAGRIAKRHADEGTIVSSGSPVFRLVEQTRLEAWIGLPADVTSELELGASYQVVVNDTSYSATLARVSPELDPMTRTRNVILTIAQDKSSQLVPGQVARLTVPIRLDEQGYWVPSNSLLRSARGLWSVLVATESATGHTLESREVEAIHFDGERVLIRGTITPGEQVVAAGSHRVVVGQVVELVKR